MLAGQVLDRVATPRAQSAFIISQLLHTNPEPGVCSVLGSSFIVVKLW